MEEWGELIFNFAVLAVFILIVTVVAFGIISGLGAVFARINFEKFTTGMSSACTNGYAEIEDFSLPDNWNIVQVYPNDERLQEILDELNQESGMMVFSPLYEGLRSKVRRTIILTNTSCNSRLRPGTGGAFGAPCLCLVRAPSFFDLNIETSAYEEGEYPVPSIETREIRNVRLSNYAPEPMPEVDESNAEQVIPYYTNFLYRNFADEDKSDYALLRELSTFNLFTPVSTLNTVIPLGPDNPWPVLFINRFETCISMEDIKCKTQQSNQYNNSAILAMKNGNEMIPVFMISENSQARLISFEKSESTSTFEPVYMSTPS